jgi:nicotinate phosphoribosyltransferase
MSIANFALRAHNGNFETDYAIRSLLDTDFYKLLMAQVIWKQFPTTKVRFSLINRSVKVPLGTIVDEKELRRQLDHVRTLRFRKSELIWLRGNTFYGTEGIFEPDFIRYLGEEFRLPDYRLGREGDQWVFETEGLWSDVTMWEIHALAIFNELKTRAGLSTLSEFELDELYARAKTKLLDKLGRMAGVPGLKIADFGTRRRHSFLWQEYAVEAARAKLGPAFVGTSNAYLAYKHDLEAIGTNAHELPMVLAAMAEDDDALADAPYRVLRVWEKQYPQALRIVLPDAYGSMAFYENAPNGVEQWSGERIDSKDPHVRGEEYIAWLKEKGQDPRTKLIIPSDGLDVDEILALHARFGGRILGGLPPQHFRDAAQFHDKLRWHHEPRIRISMGWGTLLTNDFRDCHPRGETTLDPISLVCKVSAVDADGRWKPAVKLSDNYTKATGPKTEVTRYRRVFGTKGVKDAPVVV